jgi:hypothetical protein
MMAVLATAGDIKSQQDETAGRLIAEILHLREKASNVDTDEQRALASSLSFLFLQLERSSSSGARRALASTYLLVCDAGCSSDRQDATLAHGKKLLTELRKVSQRYAELCSRPNTHCVDQKKLEVDINKMIEMLETENKRKK